MKLLLLGFPLLVMLPACHAHRGDKHGGPPHDDTAPTRDTAANEDVDDTAQPTDTSAADTAADDTSTNDGRDSSDSGASGGGSGVTFRTSAACSGAALQLTDARVDVDRTAVPVGGTYTFTVTLTNGSGSDDMHYPGVLFRSTSAHVTPSAPGNWLYGLFAGTSNELTGNFTVGADAPAPAAVEIEATTTRLGCEHGETATPDGVACPVTCTLSFPLTLAP